MSDIELFISYASEDFADAKRLYQSLSDVPEIRLWMDKETLLPGDTWEESILSAIARCRFFIVVLTPTAVRKDGFVKTEVAKAVDCLRSSADGKYTIIPVRLSQCEVTDDNLKSLHIVDMFPDWEKGIAELRKAIRSRIKTDIDAAFSKLRQCRWQEIRYEVEWTAIYGNEMLRLPPETVIEFLDKKFDKFGDELYAISVLVTIAHKSRSTVLADYVVRSFEIARQCYAEHELPEFYGSVLACASLLSERMRALFLRDTFNYYIQHLADFFRGAWWADFALRDLAKHYMCCEKSRDVSGVTIRGEPCFRNLNVDDEVVGACLRTMEWDIPLVDLLAFYARRANHPRQLYAALTLLHRGMADARQFGDEKPAPLFRLDCPDFDDYRTDLKIYGISDTGHKLPELDFKKLHWADSRAQRSRIGLIYRIGAYLTKTNPDYGRYLSDYAATALRESSPRLTERLSRLSDDERTRLLDAVERQDDEAIGFYLDDPDIREHARDLVPRGTYALNRKDEENAPVKLPFDAFMGAAGNE
jgi:hypothetical protein